MSLVSESLLHVRSTTYVIAAQIPDMVEAITKRATDAKEADRVAKETKKKKRLESQPIPPREKSKRAAGQRAKRRIKAQTASGYAGSQEDQEDEYNMSTGDAVLVCQSPNPLLHSKSCELLWWHVTNPLAQGARAASQMTKRSAVHRDQWEFLLISEVSSGHNV